MGGAWAQMQPSSGDGSVGNPYKISSAAELAWFRDQVNSGYTTISATLTKDIDLAEFCHAKDGTKYTKEVSWTPIGNSDNIENMYQGTFDGNGKTIRNLYINDISEFIGIPCEAGFFGYAEKGSIKNITFDNAKVKTTADDYCTGILVGVAGSCIENIKILVNCSVEGKNYVGGIAGRANGDIGNCENHAMVNGAGFVGGIVGEYTYSGKSITSCANYGVITGTGSSVGGMAGYFVSGTIQNCANYGDIMGIFYVGNLIGCADECNLNNVLGTGNVTATWDRESAGLLVGNIDNSSSTASGILAYNSSAKLTINGTEQTGDAVKAIGRGSLTSAEKMMAFTAEQLKSGMVANLLQKNVSGSAKWGQKLNTDDYPLLGSADEVYSGNATLNCLGEVESTVTFTNTKPAQEGTLTVKHGDSPIHHESVDATCTTDGNIEYWECNLCHKSFSDELLTQGVSTLVVSATGHKYGENDKCTMCQKEIPSLTLGNNLITIEKTYVSRDEISGYNLYKYTAPEDGRLQVTANSNGNKTCGTLWESPTAASRLIYDDSSNWPDFKIIYTVTKGTTYYIGARKNDGNAIEGEVKLNVKMNGLDGELPTGMTGKGTEAEPFELKTAEHLAWFRDFVNEGNMEACAKIADDVKEIDMSTVCHKADTEKQVTELSWIPIGTSYTNRYQGTFDGNGKTISNLYIINAASEHLGFFGYAEKGSIKNITFDNAKVKSTVDLCTGILAGFEELCIIENIKTLANCSVEGKNGVGGIAGMASGDIGNCENHAMVNGANVVGGIVGAYRGSGKSIISCANYGVVTGTGNSVGGIAGGYGSGTIQNCANYGDITGADIVGNLIGDGSICNLNNVLGTGNVIATSDTERAGLLVGRIINSSSTASGILAYNSSAKLTINKIEQTGNAVKAIGKGSLTYPDGKNEAAVIKAFTPEQLNSGEVAYLLNGSKSEGELVWYQKLGTDAYPVLVAEESNTVYHGSFTCCDGTASSYSNSSSKNELVHVASATLTSPEFDPAKHIYHMGCLNESCPEHKYAADADGTLKATKADGKFYVEKLALTDASTAINTQAQFTIKDLQYSRQLTEGQKGYVTLCLPFDIKAADVAGAEKCYPVGDMMIHMPTNDASVLKFVLMLDEQSDIKAGTPMIVKLGAEGTAQKLVAKAQNVEYNAAPTAKSLTLRDWDGKSGFMTICHELTNASIGGVYTTTPMAEGSYSFRADGKFGIHTGDLSPYRIYLNVQPSQSASSRTMLFSIGLPDDSSTTGIRIISLGDGKQTGSSVIYTLEGQRVMGIPRKGIYIKNGKKFSVK